MNSKKLRTIGIVMPENFPIKPYEAIHDRIVKKKDSFPEVWAQYAGGWNAVVYRFLSCKEHNDKFSLSIKKFGNTPPSPERYIQEKELFGFFVNGQSTIESFCFALFAIASIVDRKRFPLLEDRNLKAISPETTKDKFNKSEFLRNERIATTLKIVIESPEYDDWKEIRNILSHRIAPGRDIFLGGNHSGKVLWLKGVQIDEDTTSLRYQWLTKIITILLNDADIFTSRLL